MVSNFSKWKNYIIIEINKKEKDLIKIPTSQKKKKFNFLRAFYFFFFLFFG